MFEVGNVVRIKNEAWERFAIELHNTFPALRLPTRPRYLTISDAQKDGTRIELDFGAWWFVLAWSPDDLEMLGSSVQALVQPKAEDGVSYLQSQLLAIGLSKATCPHCSNDDQELMAENHFFTHERHEGLHYQCHNRPTCDRYFVVSPLSWCGCGWNKVEAEKQKAAGLVWCWSWDESSYAYRSSIPLRDYRDWAKTKSPEFLKREDEEQKQRDREGHERYKQAEAMRATGKEPPIDRARQGLIEWVEEKMREGEAMIKKDDADNLFSCRLIERKPMSMIDRDTLKARQEEMGREDEAVFVALDRIAGEEQPQQRSFERVMQGCEEERSKNEPPYEVVKSVKLNGHEMRVGDKYSCLCQFEVSRLHPVWHSDTGNHWKEHEENSCQFLMTYSPSCPIHAKVAIKAREEAYDDQ